MPRRRLRRRGGGALQPAAVVALKRCRRRRRRRCLWQHRPSGGMATEQLTEHFLAVIRKTQYVNLRYAGQILKNTQ
jgi:hypothetical protein